MQNDVEQEIDMGIEEALEKRKQEEDKNAE